MKSRKDELFFQKHSPCKTSASRRTTRGSRIIYYPLVFLIAYTLKGQVHVFAGRVKILSDSSFRTSTILKYFCPLIGFTDSSDYKNLLGVSERVENLS